MGLPRCSAAGRSFHQDFVERIVLPPDKVHHSRLALLSQYCLQLHDKRLQLLSIIGTAVDVPAKPSDLLVKWTFPFFTFHPFGWMVEAGFLTGPRPCSLPYPASRFSGNAKCRFTLLRKPLAIPLNR
jgi:hypothetical protein